MSTIIFPGALATQLAVTAGDGPNAEQLARLIVYILVVIALLLTVLTVWYWNRTRPERQFPARARAHEARDVAPNQVTVPYPQTPAASAPQAPASGPQWAEPQPPVGGAHRGPQWQVDAPAAGPQWGAPPPQPSPQPQQPRPAQGPDWGEPPAQR